MREKELLQDSYSAVQKENNWLWSFHDPSSPEFDSTSGETRVDANQASADRLSSGIQSVCRDLKSDSRAGKLFGALSGSFFRDMAFL